jgi:hypothetical protein
VLSDIGLQVAEAKSGVKAVAAGFEFLGFTFQWRFLRPRPLALVRFKDQVRSCTRRQAPISLQSMIEGLNPVVRGWGNYFAQGDVISLFEDLDGWIRERLRSTVRGSKARLVARQHLTNRTLRGLGLVSLESIVRSSKLSSV